MEFARDISNRVIFMDKGSIAEQGSQNKSLKILKKNVPKNSSKRFLVKNEKLSFIVTFLNSQIYKKTAWMPFLSIVGYDVYVCQRDQSQ